MDWRGRCGAHLIEATLNLNCILVSPFKEAEAGAARTLLELVVEVALC
jgi:hypothetical protein